ncbi:hypothetical protein [Bacteriovorax sp. DB6_IX]|uniref:hypothetical protein n=1 Tax=Bacteriovorax sp. DB6_IX TaxID=1353530 RepID=UPI00038A12B2|nr:hypothetical protein [Bacteriovorax sp. DB6_IX]EQC47960.1 hypothetical protein M901_1121 [Bacteriovorax sp. DB6_IX]
MNLDNKKIKGLLQSLAIFGALFLVSPHIGIDPKEVAIFYGKILILVILINLLFWFLDKKGIIDLKKEEQERLELQKKLKSNKMNLAWFFGGFLGIVAIFIIPVYFFSTPKIDNPWISVLEIDLIKSYYWAFCLVFYSFASYVFIFGKYLLINEKGRNWSLYRKLFYFHSFHDLHNRSKRPSQFNISNVMPMYRSNLDSIHSYQYL